MSISFALIVSDLLIWTILILVLVIGLFSVFFYGKKGVSKNRLWVKIGLFVGFWAFLALSLLRPQVLNPKESESWLVYQSGLERAEIEFWKDSLGLENAVEIMDFEKQSDQVILLGKKFSEAELYPFRRLETDWFLPRENGLIRDISWKGYLRKGELQRVTFSVFSTNPDQVFKLGIPKTDSLILNSGWNQGILEFATSGQGRAEVPLILGSDTLSVLRYFVGPSVPKKYQFQLGFPSAESRALATFLREKGETVSEQIQLSKESFLVTDENKDSLQIRIIDPAQLNQKSLQDWIKEGKENLMLIQVADPVALSQQVNRLFGTDFELEAAKTELENGLEALPFRWKKKRGQKAFLDDRIAIEQAGSRQIGISLLESSYPLILEGKRDAYEEIWGEVFGAMEPAEPRSKRLDAPIFQGLETQIQLFDQDSLPEFWSIGEDTLWLKPNPINEFQATGDWLPTKSGWMDAGEDLSVYSFQAEEFPAVSTGKYISQLQQDSRKTEKEQFQQISPWIGLVGMLVFLGGMWVEPKL
ncbi:hypothetical protein [Algoriphagus taiwanensis]|uniref:Aerotolerance regulator N-terminal domain-containing protein n=1 Tax=Algoriphagus taiwanensis TaxID=1445656 RepID=A0ABQ6Q7K4_9BACT|nr:hypothetical protein Ataiwa_32600 [Algoriphagus taiwanensis]